jgi:hypothetical protein
MTNDPDLARAVRSWLDEGADRLPDRVLDAVLASVPTTRQRRSPWPVWRFNDVSNLVRIAAVTAAVVAVGVVGYQFLPSSDVGAGPTPTPVASTPASPTASTTSDLDASSVGSVAVAGAHRVIAPFMKPFEITLPAGYEVRSLASGEASFHSDAGYLGVLIPEAVFPDPCAAGEPVTATTADEFITALSSMTGFTAEDPRTITIGGLPATSFLLTNTVDTSTGACARDKMLPIFNYVDNPPNGAETNGGMDELFYVLEVDGRTVFIVVDSWQTPEGLAELQGIVGDIRFD